MQTLIEVKKEMYENMKNRYNDFLSEEERYIVENLKSEFDWKNDIVIYTEDQACDIVCQSLDWLCMTDTENACWEAWYIRWYEVALKELKYKYEKTIEYDASYKAKQIVENLEYLLTN